MNRGDVRFRALLWASLSLGIGMLVAAAAFAQEKYRLRDAYAAGDTCTVDTSMDLDLELSVSTPGQEVNSLPVVTRWREGYRQSVLATDARGPSGLRRNYTIARTVTLDPSHQERKATLPLQGKTVVIQRKGGKVVVTASPGKLPARELQPLARELEHSDMEAFPDREVRVGEQWPIDPKLMMRRFPGMDRADATYQFQEVVQYAGHPCARIRVTLELAGQVPQAGVPLTAQLTGDLYHALDLKRMLGYDLRGPTTIKAEKDEHGISMTVEGTGTIRVKETRRWQKVRGRSVAAKP
jgi:hypothetical protein